MHVIARPPKQVHVAWPVGHKSSGLDEISGTVDHRQSRAEREGKNAIEVGDDKLVDHDIKRICLRVELLEHRRNVLPTSYIEKSAVELQFTRRGFRIALLQHRLIIATIEDNSQSTQLRDQFPQNLDR